MASVRLWIFGSSIQDRSVMLLPGPITLGLSTSISRSNMKLQVQSRRVVKPTNTEREDGAMSKRSRVVPFSSADFALPPLYVQIMYAFTAPTPPTALLERGLAEVLSEYREWAGRLVKDGNGRPAIELNDGGVVWVEAVADGILEDAMPFDPSPFLLQLFPPHDGVPELLLIQVTRFACGGLVIGVSWHHQVADGSALRLFMNSWSQTVRGKPIYPVPIHDRSLLMAKNPPCPTFDHPEYCNLPQPVKHSSSLAYKRFHFRKDFLNEIKATASQNAGKSYTRFESLVAHLWRRVSIARGLHEDVLTRARFPVNTRTKLNPPLPLQYFGNAICASSTARIPVKELVEKPLQFAANLIHRAVTRIDNEYMRSSLDFLEIHHNNPKPRPTGALSLHSPNVNVTSTVNLPTYELDFGWGCPLYAGPSLLPIEALMVIFPSYTKDGSLDVVISLFEQHMAKLQQICYSI